MAETWIYVMACMRGGELSSPVKVGVSRDPHSRVSELSTGCPYPMTVYSLYPFDTREEAMFHERMFHQCERDKRMSGEWFDMTPQEADEKVYLDMMIMDHLSHQQ